ncbi:WYL domain-containing protein [Nakamurella flavida]|uniref:WYL domain-containing protein n=1 Tax=Nakamurella flavida TaxID=363630 RepID=A0A939C418_9ACTN|nr:WYL domain-containing protein [Nakamurella flavida]MBM9478275.1 WYL domain-containing protein [Nakamurella flavida]MDP9777554.1 putative DNA-binding transcriptional regulator YafY [Nakamurella flavida]
MATTSARLLRLLSLLQSGDAWTGPALAEALRVSDRTVRRDVDALRNLGYAVDVSRGPGGRYRLGPGPRLPPLVFDEEQAIAVAVALQAAPRSIIGLDAAAARALETLLQVLPPRLGQQVAGLTITSVVNLWDLAPPPVDAVVLRDVSTAIHRTETLRYTIGSAAASPASTVEPHHLVSWAGRWCLLGWNPTGRRWQALRLDLLTLRTPNGPRFDRRMIPGGDVAAYFTTLFDRGDNLDHWPCQGSAVVDQPAELIARFAPGGTRVQPLGPTSSRVTMGAWSWNGIASLLGSFDAVVRDAEPAALREACRELAARYR